MHGRYLIHLLNDEGKESIQRTPEVSNPGSIHNSNTNTN